MPLESSGPRLRVSGLIEDSIVDGPGLRLSIFAQGCSHACPSCHNPATHSFEGGRLLSAQEVWSKVQGNPLLDGVTFSGGDPFFQAEACAALARFLWSKSLHLMAYTGFRWEELMASARTPGRMDFLSHLHWLVDGRFVRSLRTLELPWRGSLNQRVIDVQASLAAGEVVEVEHPETLMEWVDQMPSYQISQHGMLRGA